ncbi:MAG: hypothetical protein QG629_852 [Patescibacteria group bacterium]|nr:hypothetical protein [Candidatus Saccharibacteria bacterium]MDQ5963769.1 hypothetical protein [Patescibacteria group bacterium]
MIHENWGYVAAIMNILGVITYLIAVVKGTARPNRVTWFVLSVAPLVAFASMLSQDVSLAQSAMTLSAGLSPLMIFITTFLVKHPAWKIETFDIACGALAILGIVLWWITGEGNVAIAFSIIADSLAFLPTLIKSYKYPETESPWAFIIGTVACIMSVLTITSWDFEHYGFPVYLVIANALAVLFIYGKVGVRKSLEQKD